jgi:hypothetical protein
MLASQKSITEEGMLASLEEQRTLLEAMWRGDGSRYTAARSGRPTEEVSTYATAPRLLALQTQEMLLRQGQMFGISQMPNRVFLVSRDGTVHRSPRGEGARGWIPLGMGQQGRQLDTDSS